MAEWVNTLKARLCCLASIAFACTTYTPASKSQASVPGMRQSQPHKSAYLELEFGVCAQA